MIPAFIAIPIGGRIKRTLRPIMSPSEPRVITEMIAGRNPTRLIYNSHMDVAAWTDSRKIYDVSFRSMMHDN